MTTEEKTKLLLDAVQHLQEAARIIDLVSAETLSATITRTSLAPLKKELAKHDRVGTFILDALWDVPTVEELEERGGSHWFLKQRNIGSKCYALMKILMVQFYDISEW